MFYCKCIKNITKHLLIFWCHIMKSLNKNVSKTDEPKYPACVKSLSVQSYVYFRNMISNILFQEYLRHFLYKSSLISDGHYGTDRVLATRGRHRLLEDARFMRLRRALNILHPAATFQTSVFENCRISSTTRHNK